MSAVVALKNRWTWLVCGLDGAVRTTLDGLATNQAVQYVLNDTSQFTCDVPTDQPEIYRRADDGHPFVQKTQRIIYGLRRDGTAGQKPYHCRWAGILDITEDQAESDEPVTHLTAYDPWTWAKTLPLLNIDGSLPGQKGVTYTGKTGDYIAKDVLANAYAWIVATWPPPFPWTVASINPDALFIDISGGTYESTPVIPTITFQQGSSVADAWTQLAQTGTCDIVLSPRYAPREDPGVVARLNVYAQAGTDQPGAIFGWDMWPRNLVGISDLLDGTQTENWAQFFAGGLAAPHAKSDGSINKYGPYFVSKNYSGPSNAAAVGLLAEAEVALRKEGRQTLMIQPTPELSPDPFTLWNLGDTVAVWAGRDMPPVIPYRQRGEVAGYAFRRRIDSVSHPTNHRVYGFELDLSDDVVETVTNLLLTDPGTTD